MLSSAMCSAIAERLNALVRLREAGSTDWLQVDMRMDDGMFHSQATLLRALPAGARVLDVGCGNNGPLKAKALRPDCFYVGLDVGEYNQSGSSMADQYVITNPESFAPEITGLGKFEAVLSTHNLEHCDDRDATFEAMLGALESGGQLYLLCPSEKSVVLPSRRGGLNYRDDHSHKGEPPCFDALLSRLESFDFLVAEREYQPTADFLRGLLNEQASVETGWIQPGTWSFYGFEAMIWARKRF